ncbi:MAG: diguanylate cyclase [Deltaproteobacteria bacterium]|nr:diguanylate cyclase [Deltaproteobacteria bacterium]
MYEKLLHEYLIEQPLELTPEFVRKNAEVVPLLFQVSLLSDLDVRVEKIPEIFLYFVELITSFDVALLYVWEPQESWFCRGIQGEIPVHIEEGNLFTRSLRKTVQPMLIPDFSETGLASDDMPIPFSSMMGLPIYIDTKTIGCVELYRKDQTPFTINDIILLKHLLLYSEKALLEVFGPIKEMDEALDVRMDLPQKHVLLDIIHQYEEQAKRLSSPLSIALISVQDEHSWGLYEDYAGQIRRIKALAKRIKDVLRCYDKVLRYEETSYCVILPGCSSVDAIAALQDMTMRLGSDLAENTVNIGVATLPDEVQDAKGLINAAHQALSFAKKNTFSIASFFQTGALKETNLSLELFIRQVLNSGPSLETLNLLLRLVKNQSQAKMIRVQSSGPGCIISWQGHDLGYLYHEDLSEDICDWISSYIAPAWAVASSQDSDVHNWYLGILTTASILSDMRSGCPLGYSIKNADEVYTLAKAMGKDEAEALRWSNSCLASNLGYLGIPTSIFTKEDLTPFDQTKIKAHPFIAARLFKDPAVLDLDSDILMYHHEHLDGSGYPRGLKGDVIPEGARALRVVDTYNAITSPRLYRHRMDRNDAFVEMETCSGKLLDPEITKLYLELIDF